MRKLTKEDEDYLRDNLRYDPETGELWWTKPLKRRQINKPAGSYDVEGYLRVEIKLPSCTLGLKCHRIAWFLHYGVWPVGQIDHINGDKSDNRINNLRVASNQENSRNKVSRPNSSSKYKGVSWHKVVKKWRASFMDGYKSIYLGCYTSEEEAARAYDKAARERYGEYARLNFPEEHEQGATHGHDL